MPQLIAAFAHVFVVWSRAIILLPSTPNSGSKAVSATLTQRVRPRIVLSGRCRLSPEGAEPTPRMESAVLAWHSLDSMLPGRKDAWVARVVWSVWAALSVANLGLILALGADLPFRDDWSDLVPLYTGDRPIDAASLWRAHNEHRLVLTRLVQVAMGWATNHDFRAGSFFSAIVLSLTSALLLRRAREVDGRMRLTDCALPLLLLHWGHYLTLLWSYQIHAALVGFIACGLLAIILRHPERPTLAATVTFGVGLLALPLCQAAGVALAPVLALWCAVVGVRDLRVPATRRRGWLTLALAAAGVSMAAACYLPPHFSTARDPLRALWWSEVMLSTAFGAIERRSLLLELGLPAFAAALLLATGVLLLRVARSQPGERLRVTGMGLFLLAFLAIALGIAWGRQEGALSDRYPALAAPFFCGVYLAWRRYAPGRSGALVCGALLAVLLLLLPLNISSGLAFARQQAETAAAFERDVRAGMPVEQLAKRYVPVLHPREGILRKNLRRMRDAKIGVFRPED